MDRYLILDTKENAVISANFVEFTDPTDGGSVACHDLCDAITEMELALENLREIAMKQANDNENPCEWCGEKCPESDLKETSMGKMCDKCVRGVESREGKI